MCSKWSTISGNDSSRSIFRHLKRSKWSDSDQTPLRVNDIVWILKDKTPRGIWPLGRVLEVYPGLDGQHRVVKVKTAYGTYVRPVSALARVLAD